MITQEKKRNKTVINFNSAKPSNEESYLWVLLNNKKLKGKKFIRHYQIGEFEVDFYCPEERLALILDGEDMYTDFNIESDLERKNFIKSQNINVIQIDKNSVISNSKEIIEKITREFTF